MGTMLVIFILSQLGNNLSMWGMLYATRVRENIKRQCDFVAQLRLLLPIG
jgi:hypothetical protein